MVYLYIYSIDTILLLIILILLVVVILILNYTIVLKNQKKMFKKPTNPDKYIYTCVCKCISTIYIVTFLLG